MVKKLDFSFDRTVTGEELLVGSGRLGRLAWLAKRIPEKDLYLLQDGAFSQFLFSEVSESFVNGQFIATIVLGFSFIERTIAGRLSFVSEKNAAKGTSEQLIDAALAKGWVTTEEKKLLNNLRALRNPIVHFKEPLAQNRPEIRALMEAKTASQLLEHDAKNILEAMIHVLNKTAL